MNINLIEMAGVALRTFRAHPRARVIIIGASALVTAVLLIATMLPLNVAIFQLLPGLLLPGLLTISAATTLVGLLSYTSLDLHSSSVGLGKELEELRKERAKLQQRLAESSTTPEKEREDVFDTIQLSLNQITEYYTINKSQAVSSFRFSVFAIVVGLVTLVGGVWLFYVNEPRDIGLTAITGIASVLAEFIGAAYFYLYNKSLAQLNFFYEKLVGMQDTMLAIQMAETLPYPTRTEMKQRLIISLMERGADARAENLRSKPKKQRANKRLNPTATPDAQVAAG